MQVDKAFQNLFNKASYLRLLELSFLLVNIRKASTWHEFKIYAELSADNLTSYVSDYIWVIKLSVDFNFSLKTYLATLTFSFITVSLLPPESAEKICIFFTTKLWKFLRF